MYNIELGSQQALVKIPFELCDHRQIRIWEEHWDERKHHTETYIKR